MGDRGGAAMLGEGRAGLGAVRERAGQAAWRGCVQSGTRFLGTEIYLVQYIQIFQASLVVGDAGARPRQRRALG